MSPDKRGCVASARDILPRPWAVYGEGPSTIARGGAGGPFNEGRRRYTAQDLRCTTRGEVLHVICLIRPEKGGTVSITSLASGSPRVKGEIGAVRLLGKDAPLGTTRGASGLTVTLPAPRPESAKAPVVLKIALGR